MCTDTAKTIRAELKTAGYNRTKVSVRTDSYSMGSTVYVTIKSADVDYREVNKIAKSHERVHRCSYSGDILNGGNAFVIVEYDDDLVLGKLTAVIADRAPEVGSNAVVSLDLGDLGTVDLCRDAQWRDSYEISGEDSEGRHYCDRSITARGIVICLLRRHGPAVAPALLALSAPTATTEPTSTTEPTAPTATVIAFPAPAAPSAPPAPSVADLEAAAAEAAQATAAAQAALEAAQAAVNAAMIAETDALKALIAARKAG